MRLSPSPTRHRISAGRAFTLVELLVVIGIIALLISILLPTLSNARRQAYSVQCLAALKEIGNGFQLYAIDNRGYWPSARDRKNADGTANHWHSWTDLIAKYMNGTKNWKNYYNVAEVRRRSVIWGCPQWTKSNEYNPNAPAYAAENVYTGYGMQYYPTYWEDGKAAGLASASTTSTGSGYIKASVWQRKPSSDRLLIADAVWDIIASGAPRFSSIAGHFQPFHPAGFPAGVPYITIDARHMKPGTRKNAAVKSNTVNVLFCDLHAASTSPKQAWNAVHNPGKDNTIP